MKALKVFVLLGVLALGWQLGRWQEARRVHDARAELMLAMSQNQAMLDDCFFNMKNQFTPGFKGSLPIVGLGTLCMAQGQIFATQTPTNFALSGPGFFMVGEPDRPVFTRDGRFALVNGTLCDEVGRPLLGYRPGESRLSAFPAVDFFDLRVDEIGQIRAREVVTDPVTGQVLTTLKPPVFTLAVAQFPRPERLARFGASNFVPTPDSGQARIDRVGELRNVTVQGSALELSNVDFNQQGMMIGAIRQQAGMLGVPLPPQGPPPPPMPMNPLMNPAPPLFKGP